MEQNIAEVQRSEELREGTRALLERAVETAEALLERSTGSEKTARGGRKAHRLEVERPASHQ
jgi:hypothetical protein